MDGKNLTRRTLQILNEASTAAIIDSRTTYDYLYDGAKDFVVRTKCMTNEQTITTVASTSDYVLNWNYLGLFFRQNERHWIKYYNGSSYTFIEYRSYDDIYYENDTTAVSIPSYFTIMDYRSLYSQVTGTANADGAATGGKCTLTTAAATFTNVTPGDIIHNTTDGSVGVVVTYTSTTSIAVCLFGGTNNDISNADAFVIQPKPRWRLIFSPPPSTAGHYAYVPYLEAPNPVYSDYDVYRIAFDYTEALANYAAWRYKFKDKQFDYADNFYATYLKEVDKYISQTAKAKARKPVQFIPRIK